MYSEKLERLIQLSIEDGEVDDASWAILLKKANEEGVAPDELTLYVNSLLKKLNRAKNAEMTEKVQVYEKAKKEAIGNICPQCGQQIPPLSLSCPYCGCEVTNKKGASSATDLLNKIEEINNPTNNNNKALGALGTHALNILDKKMNKEEREKRIIDTISMYPVPNTKEDISEFLSLCASQATQHFKWYNTQKGRVLLVVIVGILFLPIYGLGLIIWAIGIPWVASSSTVKETSRLQKRRDVWNTKLKQIIMKGRSIQGDTEFQKQLDFYEDILNNK